MELSTDPACGANKLATYVYDPLSRRTSLTYGNNASMAYTYFPSGDLQTLNHNMSGSGDDPQYTFTYTAAHELHTEANSDADYVWQPSTTATTSYAAANNLNQYPNVNGTPFGYDANGNLTSDGTWSFVYDADNRLSTANKTAGGTVAAAYAYDPLGRRNHKSGTGVTEAYFLNDGDDPVVDYNSSKAVVGALCARSSHRRAHRHVDPQRRRHLQPRVLPHQSPGQHHRHFERQRRQARRPLRLRPLRQLLQAELQLRQPGHAAVRLHRPAARSRDRLLLLPRPLLLRRRSARRPLPADRSVGYTGILNLYTYVGNDPTNKTDPMGLYGMDDAMWDRNAQMVMQMTPGATRHLRRYDGPSARPWSL